MKRKIEKDHIQKIVLGVLLFIGVVFGYFNLLLGPLKSRQKSVSSSISALDPEIKKANATIARAQAVEVNAPQAEQTVAEINAMIPEGAPVSWFPVLIGDFFKQAGFEKSVTRMLNEETDKDIEGYRRIGWGVDIPETQFVGFGSAIAELENDEPLIAIKNITIESIRDNPEFQHVLLTVNNIAKE